MSDYSIELPGGIRILNPVPTDNRGRVDTLNSIEFDPTYYVGFSPILEESTGKTFIVKSGDPVNGWTFKEIYNNLPPAGGDINYVHNQTTSTDAWVIQHNLGKYPSVTIVNDVGDNVEGFVEYQGYNKLTINFNVALIGVAYLN
jgi:hypothetical protein